MVKELWKTELKNQMCKSLVERFNDTIKVWIIFSIFPPSVLILSQNLKKGLILYFGNLVGYFYSQCRH